jgi:hypothetical protein
LQLLLSLKNSLLFNCVYDQREASSEQLLSIREQFKIVFIICLLLAACRFPAKSTAYSSTPDTYSGCSRLNSAEQRAPPQSRASAAP